MAREDAIAGPINSALEGKSRAVERPVGMVVQLFKPLVETINRREERHWIGDVNRHRHVQRGTSFPHGIEARIVNLHQFAGSDVFPQIEAEGL